MDYTCHSCTTVDYTCHSCTTVDDSSAQHWLVKTGVAESCWSQQSIRRSPVHNMQRQLLSWHCTALQLTRVEDVCCNLLVHAEHVDRWGEDLAELLIHDDFPFVLGILQTATRRTSGGLLPATAHCHQAVITQAAARKLRPNHAGSPNTACACQNSIIMKCTSIWQSASTNKQTPRHSSCSGPAPIIYCCLHSTYTACPTYLPASCLP